MDTNWVVYGVPTVALALACVGYAWLWIQSRAFDRKWNHPPGN